MHICIFQTGEPLHLDKGNYRPMRAISLCNKLIDKNHKVTLISSCFFHQRKTFRSRKFKKIYFKKNLTIILIPSIGYKKHIGLKRLIDHLILAYNLNIFLNKDKLFLPDKIFLGYPPIESSLILLNWALKHKIPLMIDIKDNWPINFLEPFPKFLKPIARLFLTPYFLISKYVFRKVSKINSISKEFNEWIRNFSKNKETNYIVTPLVREPIEMSKDIENSYISFWRNKNIEVISRKHFCFVGSITKSYNFDFIIKSAEFLNSDHPEYKFIICGSGDKFEELIKITQNFENILILGEIDKYAAKVLIKNSLGVLAPYKNSRNFKNSLPNKVIESFENSVPIITNLEGKLQNMIYERKNGIFIPELTNAYLSQYLKIINDKNYQKEISKNAEKTYKELFNFNIIYDRLISEIINM